MLWRCIPGLPSLDLVALTSWHLDVAMKLGCWRKGLHLYLEPSHLFATCLTMQTHTLMLAPAGQQAISYALPSANSKPPHSELAVHPLSSTALCLCSLCPQTSSTLTPRAKLGTALLSTRSHPFHPAVTSPAARPPTTTVPHHSRCLLPLASSSYSMNLSASPTRLLRRSGLLRAGCWT